MKMAKDGLAFLDFETENHFQNRMLLKPPDLVKRFRFSTLSRIEEEIAALLGGRRVDLVNVK